MIRRGFDALYYLDRAECGRMIDRRDIGERSHAAWQIVDVGRWVADLTEPVGDLLIREALVEDVAVETSDEPRYRLTLKGLDFLNEMILDHKPVPLVVDRQQPVILDGPARMIRRLKQRGAA